MNYRELFGSTVPFSADHISWNPVSGESLTNEEAFTKSLEDFLRRLSGGEEIDYRKIEKLNRLIRRNRGISVNITALYPFNQEARDENLGNPDVHIIPGTLSDLSGKINFMKDKKGKSHLYLLGTALVEDSRGRETFTAVDLGLNNRVYLSGLPNQRGLSGTQRLFEELFPEEETGVDWDRSFNNRREY